MSYVDLHLHLLPGVDDGARDEPEALAHVRRLAAEGVRDVTVTPHIKSVWPLEIATIPARVAALQEAVDERGLGVRLYGGGEIDPARVPDLSAADLEVLGHGPPGSRWVLLEAPFGGLDESFTQACSLLRQRGYGALIAHPERSDRVLESIDLLRGCGALLQVNVCSLLGDHGLQVQETAVALLRRGLAFVLASDGHPGKREHTLRLGFTLALRAGASSLQAWRLTQANPRFLLSAGIPPLSAPAREATAPALAAC